MISNAMKALVDDLIQYEHEDWNREEVSTESEQAYHDLIAAIETLERERFEAHKLVGEMRRGRGIEPDAELGRLVRRMPEEIDKYESWTSLQYHRESNYDWYPNGWQIESSDQADAHQYTNGGKPFDTPEAAIKAALGEK